MGETDQTSIVTEEGVGETDQSIVTEVGVGEIDKTSVFTGRNG